MSLDPIKCFRLREIKVRNARFRPAKDIDDLVIDAAKTTVQTRRWVEHAFGKRAGENGQADFLKTIVHFGLRLVNIAADQLGSGEEGKDQVVYTIESSFAVYFEIKCRDYDEAGLAHFLEANVPHIAWPFWREHVFSTLRSASLPLVDIPLMPGIPKSQQDQPDPQ
jgi:hypothetical protein